MENESNFQAAEAVAPKRAKKVVVLFVTVVVMAATISLSWMFLGRSASEPAPPADSPQVGEERAVEPTELPSGFEANGLPLELNVPVIENYDMLLENGGAQSMRSYVSGKTVDENISAHKEYFGRHKWSLELESEIEGALMLSARSEEYSGSRLEIMVSPLEGGKSLVSIYLVRRLINRVSN